MRKVLGLILFLALSLALPTLADVTNVDATVTFTNQITSRGATTNGDTITWNGSVRRYTNGVLNDASLWILSTNNLGHAATNTVIHFNTYGTGLGYDYISFANSSGTHLTNAFRAVSTIGSNITITLSSGVGTVSYVTNVYSQYKPVAYPVGGLPTENARTNNINGFVEVMSDLGARATNAIPNGVRYFSNILDRITQQTASNKVFWATTNNGGLLDGMRITNAIAIWGSNGTLVNVTNIAGTYSGWLGALTNGSLYSNAVSWARVTNVVGLHGSLTRLQDGVLTNTVLDRVSATNFINYGNAIRSEGAAGNSLQVGSNTFAVGNLSVVIGNNSSGSNSQDIVVGNSSSATNSSVIIVGNGNTGGGNFNIIVDQNKVVTAEYAITIGTGTGAAPDTNAIQIGISATATKKNAVAVGPSTSADGVSAASFAYFAYALAPNSLAVGPEAYVYPTHTNSSAVGYQATTSARNQVQLGSPTATVSVPGILSAVDTTNTHNVGTNRLEGDLSLGGSYSISSVANGHNTLDMGTNIVIDLTGAPSATWQISGIKINTGAPRNNQWVKLWNLTGFDADIVHNDGLEATAAFRITTATSTNVIFTNGACATLRYRASAARWYVEEVFSGHTVQALTTASATNAVSSIQTNGAAPGYIGTIITNILWTTGVTGYLNGATAILGINAGNFSTNATYGFGTFLPQPGIGTNTLQILHTNGIPVVFVDSNSVFSASNSQFFGTMIISNAGSTIAQAIFGVGGAQFYTNSTTPTFNFASLAGKHMQYDANGNNLSLYNGSAVTKWVANGTTGASAQSGTLSATGAVYFGSTLTNVGPADVTGVTTPWGGIAYPVNVIAGAGNGNTNYTLQAPFGKMLAGSSNINITAVMGGVAGFSYFPQVTFTNLSGIVWGFGVSSVTNSWHWMGPAGTNPPTSIPAGFELNLALEVRGTTNIVCGWMTNAACFTP